MQSVVCMDRSIRTEIPILLCLDVEWRQLHFVWNWIQWIQRQQGSLVLFNITQIQLLTSTRNRATNCDILGLELAQNFREITNSWNIRTDRWLKHCILSIQFLPALCCNVNVFNFMNRYLWESQVLSSGNDSLRQCIVACKFALCNIWLMWMTGILSWILHVIHDCCIRHSIG
jgi:hypothetical protein